MPIEIRGLGSFGLRQRRARTGRNPQTGEAVQVPAKRICYFKPGKTLRRHNIPLERPAAMTAFPAVGKTHDCAPGQRGMES